MATEGEVQDFLNLLRTCIEFGAKVVLRPTPKNIQGLASLNMIQAQAVARIAQLTCADYCGGPEADRDEDGKEVWKFGCDEGGTEVYIKLRLDPNKSGQFSTLVIRSFHPAEYSLCYPLRKGGGL